jgi:hypothetical protein
MNNENEKDIQAKIEITPEQQEAINKLGNYLLREYFANLHPSDKSKKTNPVEVLVRSAIKHVIEMLGSKATPENVAAGLYEVLHIGDNISYFLKQIQDKKVDLIVDGLKRHRHKSVL